MFISTEHLPVIVPGNDLSVRAGARIRQLRLEKGINPEQLARMLGISEKLLNDLETYRQVGEDLVRAFSDPSHG